MRSCSECYSYKTYIKKNGHPKWFRHPRTRKQLCRNCFRRLQRAEKTGGPHDTMTMTPYSGVYKRSPLHQAMMKHLTYLVRDENKEVWYDDFKTFEVDGITYEMPHGTFRNHILQAKKDGEVKVYDRSVQTFYTLPDVRITKRKSGYLLGVYKWGPLVRKSKASFISNFITSFPLNSTSFHNIHLLIAVPNLYSTLSLNSSFTMNINPDNKGIVISFSHENRDITITVNPTDNITIMIACSHNAFPLTPDGFSSLCDTLSVISFKLSESIRDSISPPSLDTSLSAPIATIPLSTVASHSNSTSLSQSIATVISSSLTPVKTILIPSYKYWIVSLWHLNADSMVRYTGEAFCIDVQGLGKVLGRIYTKERQGGKGKERYLRIEIQESPMENVIDLIKERLFNNPKNREASS